MEPPQSHDQEPRVGFELKADIIERSLDRPPLAESMSLHRNRADRIACRKPQDLELVGTRNRRGFDAII